MSPIFARKLNRYFSNFQSLIDSATPSWVQELPLAHRGNLIGYIQNIEDPTDIFVFGNDSLCCRNKGNWHEIPYELIVSIETSPSKIGPPFYLGINTTKLGNHQFLTRDAYAIHSVLKHPAIKK